MSVMFNQMCINEEMLPDFNFFLFFDSFILSSEYEL